MEQQQQQTYVANLYSKQLAKKMKQEAPPAPAPSIVPMGNVQQEQSIGGGDGEVATRGRALRSSSVAMAAPAAPAGGGGGFFMLEEPPRRDTRGPAYMRPKTDTLFRWNALPNEYIVSLGEGEIPVLGGSVSKLRARGVLRFPSSIQRIEFHTDNISAENQGILVEGWACWRVSDARLSIEKLDFSDPRDPMARTSHILGIECAGIMKGLISVKSVEDMLKRREDLIDKLKEKLKATEKRWGISFDEIGISEVQVLSQDVFENLQRPFRNEAREVASTSDLDTEQRIAEKTATQRERVAQIESGSEEKLKETEETSRTRRDEIRLREEEKRLKVEEKVKALRLEEKKRVEALDRKLKRELEAEARESEKLARLRAIATEQEREIAELEAANQRELARARAEEERRHAELKLSAERERAEVEAEREIQAARRERELLKTATEQALAEAEATRLAESIEQEAAREKSRTEGWAEVQRQRMSVDWEKQAMRLKVQERERVIESKLSEGEVRARLIDTLPRIAESIKIGDVKWYGGGGADGASGPHGILAASLGEVIRVCDLHGLKLPWFNEVDDDDADED